MGLFDWFRRRRPTPEQEAPLARITNPQQRAALLKAVADGEVISEYAWDPLPTKFDTFAILPRAPQAAASSNLPVVAAAPFMVTKLMVTGTIRIGSAVGKSPAISVLPRRSGKAIALELATSDLPGNSTKVLLDHEALTGVLVARIHVRDGEPWAGSVRFDDEAKRAAASLQSPPAPTDGDQMQLLPEDDRGALVAR